MCSSDLARQWILQTLRPGMPLLVQTALVSTSGDIRWREIQHAVGGGPRLLSGGQFAASAFAGYEGFAAMLTDRRHPRSALGVLGDGRIILLVVDGRRPSHSLGMTLLELTAELRRMGAVDAMNLDGGEPRRISTGTGRTTCGYFYPDGKSLLYASTHEAGPACPPRPSFDRGYVWPVYDTYDIYRALWKKEAPDAHYVTMGRWCTILGVLVSIGTAYLVMQFKSIMDYVQALFSFFIAPLFGTVLLGMLWKRATPAGGFWGLLAGTLSSIAMWAWVKMDPSALRYIALSPHAKDMAENMYRALWSWIICVVVTVVVSYLTRPLPESALRGLVYGCTDVPHERDMPLWQRPIFWAGVVGGVFLLLQIIFW